MPHSILLNRRTRSTPSFLVMLSTAGHCLLFLLFFFQLEIAPSQRTGAPDYMVTLVSPSPAGPSVSSGSVFPKSTEKAVPTETQLPETQLIESIPKRAQETGPRVPPGMSDPKDCLLKKIGEVCPNADLGCIANYVAYCVRMY